MASEGGRPGVRGHSRSASEPWIALKESQRRLALLTNLTSSPLGSQDILDSDELLDSEDLKKPDPSSLRAPSCKEMGKKKACKNW